MKLKYKHPDFGYGMPIAGLLASPKVFSATRGRESEVPG